MNKIVLCSLLHFFVTGLSAQDKPDPKVMERIINEENLHSQVMDIAFHLTDVSGPRLTNSPNFMKAANWARTALLDWGLVNSRLEPWGEFGKGWQQERCYVAMTNPYYAPMVAIPKAWTGSTPGKKMITSDIVLIKAADSAALTAYAGRLKNKIVMLWVDDTLKPSFEPDGIRLADSSLEKMANEKPEGNSQSATLPPNEKERQQMAARRSFQLALDNLYRREKPAMILGINPRGTEGTVFVQGGGSYRKDAVVGPASVIMSSDDYLRLQRLASAGIPVTMEADVKTRFFDNDLKAYNVIAEIPGTDPQLKDEVVMLGGHLDSWQGATGATDNAAGCSVMLEAVRILKALNIQPRRTIRLALWSGEEQGLQGSRQYVKAHLGDEVTLQLKPEQSKISAYYNLDNGSGRIRGVYLQENEAVNPIFKQWLEPFKAMGASTLTISNTSFTDHLCFDAIGIPGFQFIQDPIEYGTRTHHSNMDTYDHLVPADLRQASMIIAAFVYNTAMRNEKIPRKPLPKPRG